MIKHSKSPQKKVTIEQGNKKFSPQAIRKELGRILSSPEFTNAPQISRFLRFVIEESLSGRQQNINQYSIGTKALGRSSDFDPTIKPIVRIQAGRLRSTLSQYYQQKGCQDPIRIVIPMGSYVPAFYPNERFSTREDTHIQTSSSLSATNQKVRLQECPSVLLLPLTTLRDDPRQVSFAERLMVKLMVSLTRFCDFRIIGPLSCEELKEHCDHPRELGQEYDADYVLCGYLYEQEGIIKLILKLIEATTGNTLWADTFDNRKNTDESYIFEDEINRQVSSILADRHGIISRVLSQRVLNKPLELLEVCDAVFLYYYYRDDMSEDAWQSAKEALEDSVKINPNNPNTLAMLADLYTIRYDCLEANEMILRQARELFERSISINPKCQYAHFLKARFYLYSGDQRGRKLFMEEIKKTVSLNPNNASILVFSGSFMILAGELDHGMELVKEGMRLNPFIPSVYHHMAMFMYFFFQGFYEDALLAALCINKPKIIWDPLMRTAVLGQLDLKKEAGAALRELLALMPDFPTRGHEIMRRVLFSDKNVEIFFEGLHKAGLPH